MCQVTPFANENKVPQLLKLFFPEKDLVYAVEGQMLFSHIMPSLFVLKVSPAIRSYKGKRPEMKEI
jgi:hypothetical protein